MFVEFPVLAKDALSPKRSSKTARAGHAGHNEESACSDRNLAAKEVLFRVGDRRTCIYRVESGAICLYDPSLDAERSVVDFAFPGDLVGLGFLETQSYSASAICDCQVRCMPWDQLSSAVAGNPNAQQKLHEAVGKEFELLRTSIVQRGLRYPVERVAAFLVVLSHNNALEGRDPSVIGDCMECAIAADYLGLSVEELGGLLVKLRNRGLIDLCPPKSLRILDIKALQKLADQHDNSLSVNEPRDCVSDRVRWTEQQRALSGHSQAA